MDWQSLQEGFTDWVMTYGPKLIGAIITLIIGLWVIKIIQKLIVKIMDRSKLDETLKKFLSTVLGVLLKVLLFVVVLSMLGIEMTAFVALIGAIGIAIGFALQGALANLAGGILILIIKPFKVGEFISDGTNMGTVEEVHIVVTKLRTVDNKLIIVPNGQLANSTITNFSRSDKRRLDITFGIGYDDDIKLAKNTLTEIYKNHPKVHQDPSPVIAVSELGDSSVNFVVKAWVNASDYWDVLYEMQETVKLKFDELGISIPYPQMDVHVIQEK
ncbi:MAG: mechanosensitive ion channel [Kosmotoga sp.]|nr:MAG: mechanosensitive ion channel [Kosmotoga sp.]